MGALEEATQHVSPRVDGQAGHHTQVRRNQGLQPASRVPLLALIVLPFVSSFATGTYASTVPGRSQPQVGAASIRAAGGVTNTALEMAAASTTTASTTKSTAKSRNPLSNLFGRHNDDKEYQWKDGEYNATLPNKLLYKYASPLLELASRQTLTEADALCVPEKRKMATAVGKLTSIYEKCRSKARAKLEERKATHQDLQNAEGQILAKALIKSQQRALILTGILRLCNTMVQAFPALLVARLLRLVESGTDQPVQKALGTAVALVSVLSVKMIIENQYFHNVVKLATQVRGSLAGMIFDKSLRLPRGGGAAVVSNNANKTKAALGTGGVLNLMQSDASILELTALQLHTIWDGPLQIAMYTTLLFRYLGKSVLYGIAVLLLTIPINSITLRLLNRMSKYENDAKDARTKRTSEAIANMKLLKLQAWEQYFAKDIQMHRKEELQRLASRGVIRALNQAIGNAVPALVLVVTLTAYARTGQPIVASNIFTAISLFNQLRFPLFFYPMLIDSLANGKNALKRISTYLAQEEITPYVETLPPLENGGGSIEMTNGNFLWSSMSKEAATENAATGSKAAVPALCNVNLKVNPGEVVAVVGSVGVGKSALVKALLGELAPVPGAVVDSTHQPSPVLDKPSVVTHGNVAYVSQEAWLPKGTLKDAIVFGREYNEDRYQAALRDAGLDDDMVDTHALDSSDSKAAASRGVLSHNTDVGEGGSSLSGGQRARVALARALYGNENDGTKVFLMDDPLAALDASVGSTVFERMTRRLRKSGTATVLVTNDPSLPRRCDRVVLMGTSDTSAPSCSTILDVGTYDDLLAKGYDLASLTHSADGEDLHEEKEAEAEEPMPEITAATKSGNDRFIRVAGGYEIPASCAIHSEHADPDCKECMKDIPDYIADKFIRSDDIDNDDDMDKTVSDSVEPAEADAEVVIEVVTEPVQGEKKLASADDSMSTGAVPLSAYVTYLKSVRKPVLIAAMVLSYVMANGAQFFQQYTVAKWTEVGAQNTMAAALGTKYLRTLVHAAGVVSVFLWLRSYFTMRIGVKASEFLHNRMLSSVFSAPISFFDATPSGQLLSRFGKELETVDRALPDGIGSVLFCFLQIFLSGTALAGVISPFMLLPIGLISFLYIKTMSRFRPAARDLKRAESKSRSPIYTHFGEALRGAEMIRSIPGARSTWSSQHQALTDENLSVFYTVKALDRWLSIRLETLGNVIVFSSAIASVFLTRRGVLKSGSAGWGLTQALAITGLLTWAVRCLTDLESQMMSVMRVKELTDLDSDQVKGPLPEREIDGQKPDGRMPKEYQAAGEALVALYVEPDSRNMTMVPASDAALVQSGWPWKGDIQFKGVSMRYNPISPLVLKNVTISVPKGSSLGVVGRTGSGKSSLLLTLFRLVEIEKGGSIEIDKVDIRSVSLQTLRESLAIIPQDPVLFAGSLMYNLDATGKATPEDAWAALEAASPSLAREFRSTGLDSYISEGGMNLSAGQRQLICLARALLRRSRILILDEATSSVDSQTDAQVQATIQREFVEKGVTVITVAHRLDTVLGYDKIAVLGSGELLEYGTPSDLLQIPRGELRRLVDADRKNKRKGSAIKSTPPPTNLAVVQ